MNSAPDPIERAAAGWLTQSEAGLSAEQAAALTRWLEEDPRHGETYRALQKSWSQLDRLRGSKLAAQLEAELDERVISAGATGIATATPLSRWRAARPWVSGALAASVLWGWAHFAGWSPFRDARPYAETAQTEIGATRKIELPDGSILQLNTATAVEVLYTRDERRVRLSRGEAFFIIAKNRARPFIVTAAGVDVRAVGTEFNVRLLSSAVEVVVREGRVAVDDAIKGNTLLSVSPAGQTRAEVPILPAGHRVTIPVAAAVQPASALVAPVPVTPVEIERSLAWQGQRLVFESAPLSTIIAEFNRYNRQQLVIADADLGARLFGGTFVATDPSTLVELLRTSYNVVTEERGEQMVLRLRR